MADLDINAFVQSYGAGIIGADVRFNNKVEGHLDGLTGDLMSAMGAVAYKENEIVTTYLRPYVKETLYKDINNLDELTSILSDWLHKPSRAPWMGDFAYYEEVDLDGSGIPKPADLLKVDDTADQMLRPVIEGYYIQLNNALAMVTDVALWLNLQKGEEIPKFKHLVLQLGLPMDNMYKELNYLRDASNLNYLLNYNGDRWDFGIADGFIYAKRDKLKAFANFWTTVADILVAYLKGNTLVFKDES